MVKGRVKRGMWDMPVWLVWSLIALLVILFILAIASGKASDILRAIGGLLNPG
ncbi:hypothetical protein HYU20_00040 [Candidatus Woesearchaeota archaeon]|nr:hypothetical protein [Candidatus Woesearchaeota archaeon]